MIMTIDIHFQCQELGVLGYNISRKNMFWKSLFEVKIVRCNWDFFLLMVGNVSVNVFEPPEFYAWEKGNDRFSINTYENFQILGKFKRF